LSYNQLLSGEELAKKMSALLRETKQIRIVSAYITSPAIQWLEKYVTHSNIKILGRFNPQDFLSGASDIRALEMAIQHGYEIFMLDNLHAKIYELDKTTIFAGSANFTSKGLSLCSTPNSEVAVELRCSSENEAFIDKFFRDSITLNTEIIELMNKKLDEFLTGSDEKIVQDWGLDFKYNELFLADLPLSPPYETCEHYKLNPNSDFAKVSKALSSSISSGRDVFKSTKCYKWLHCLILSDFKKGIRFGELSKILHDAIEDDPSPYRKQVKEVQVNLLLFIDLLASDTFEVIKLGPRSQVITLKNYLNNE
jgi:hypothetical protein